MNILFVILLILFCALIVSFITLLLILFRIMELNKQLLKEKSNINTKCMNYVNDSEINEIAFQKLANAYILLDVAHSILFMLLNLSYNNEEKYSYYFNSLYFFGVPKESLEDMEKIMIFHENCINDQYLLVEGEKPFKYKFILKEENDEENNN